jgi:hypothetical protein
VARQPLGMGCRVPAGEAMSESQTNAARPECVQCIRSPETGNRLCNRDDGKPPFFQGLDHAYRSAIQGSRLLACKDCVEIASIYMTEGR